MKKAFVTLLFIGAGIYGFSQEKGTSDIGASVGVVTSNDFINVSSDLITSAVSAGTTTFSNKKETPSITLYYKNAIKERWFFYADANYQSFSEDVYIDNLQVGDVTNIFLTFGFGTEYHYISGEWFQMYSGLSIAYTSQMANYTGSSSELEDSNDGFFNFQVNAVGLRVGKKLAGVVELGVGYKGVASAGLSFQF